MRSLKLDETNAILGEHCSYASYSNKHATGSKPKALKEKMVNFIQKLDIWKGIIDLMGKKEAWMNKKIQFVPLFHFNQGYIHFHCDK